MSDLATVEITKQEHDRLLQADEIREAALITIGWYFASIYDGPLGPGDDPVAGMSSNGVHHFIARMAEALAGGGGWALRDTYEAAEAAYNEWRQEGA